MRHLRAKDVMTSPAITCPPETTLPEVVRLMREHHISGVPVTDPVGRLMGIVTEGDLLLKEAGPGGFPLRAYERPPDGASDAERELQRTRGRIVGDVMIRDVITADQDTPIRALACTMARRGINRVPIVADGRVLGMVTRADVLSVFVRPDDEITAEVEGILRRDLRLDPDAIEITVCDGVVTLRGEVDRAPQPGLIEAWVGEIDGVAGVDVSGLHVLDRLRAP